MSIITARSDIFCYTSPAHVGDVGLAMPSKELLASNLDRLLGNERGRSAELARYLGVTPSIISRWRKGIAAPEVEKLGAIADFFGVPVSTLFFDPTDPRSTGTTLDVALQMVAEAIRTLQSQEDRSK